MITYAEVRNNFEYNQRTGAFTRGGKKIGYLSRKGYLRCSFRSKQYPIHRLIWLWMTGEWPITIDHINCEKLDNRWKNLRNVTNEANQQNMRKATSRNGLGVLGVTNSSVGRYRAQISINGTNISLGCYDSPEEAHRIYLKAKRHFHEGCTI